MRIRIHFTAFSMSLAGSCSFWRKMYDRGKKTYSAIRASMTDASYFACESRISYSSSVNFTSCALDGEASPGFITSWLISTQQGLSYTSHELSMAELG